MTPNAATRVTALLGVSLALAAPAWAGDRAMIDFIGYSSDGRYFAFEEFGVHDGAGFPYSTIYVLDLPADKWVGGSPIRVRVDDEGSDVPTVRAQAFDEAKATLAKLKITEPAYPLAINGDGETDGNDQKLRFGLPRLGLDPGTESRLLTLETFPADSPEDCESYTGGDKALGYALIVDGEEVHRDTSLPASRGCPLAYGIYGVVTLPDWIGRMEAAVAIVSVYTYGFEGPDRRFIAVPLGN